MKKTILSLLLSCIAAIASAQTPDIRIRTSIYEKDGPTNTFTLALGAAPGHTGYADVKCSGGNQTEAELITAFYNEETAAINATNIACQVNAEGVVEVFCDEGVLIDYINCTGAEITSIEVLHPETVEILALEHNQLQSFDLTPFTNLQALYLNDNPMSLSPLTDRGEKPNLVVMEISLIENIDPAFDITRYPNLQSFDAMSTYGLRRLTPSACPRLQKISIDNTSVSELDVTKNPELLILNISESRIASIDLSKSAKLQQFFATHSSAANTDVKLREIDVTHCPNLFYLFLSDNELTTLDVTKNPRLQDLYVRNNRLTQIDLTQNPNLVNVFITGNLMDFNTLPLPQDTWGDYGLEQRPFPVPASYLAGSPLDFRKQVIRPDAETHVALFRVSETQPDIEEQLDESAYTFQDGVLTIPLAMPDSVFASFFCSAFPDCEIRTERFLVKDASTYGQPDLVATLATPQPVGTELKLHVGVSGATEEQPKQFFLDLGDGQLRTFQATTAATPAEPNVVATKQGNADIRLCMPEGEKFTALKIADQQLTALDLARSPQLQELTLAGTQLAELDLQWNRALRFVDITGNRFGSTFSLAGANGYYGKNMLTDIRLSHNQMTSVKLNEPGSWRRIDLSHNQLQNLDFRDADYLQYLDLSHNQFDYLKINYCSDLKTFLCNNNQLTELILPENNNIETFNCAENNFTLANMPDRNGLDEAHFIYAPQSIIRIPSKGPGYNLSEQDTIIAGQRTVFTWKTTDGDTLVPGTDYTIDGGVAHFLESTIGQELYCEITHPAFPAFRGDNILYTTPIVSAAGLPTHLLGSFTTLQGGQNVTITMTAAVPNASVYIDWTGTESYEQYALGTTYKRFTAKTTADARVNIWSYEDDDNLTVFSMSGAKLADVDLTPMKRLQSLTIDKAGISTLKMPQSPHLAELSLENNNFTDFNFGRYPTLTFINLSRNHLTIADLTDLTELEWIGLSNNELQDIRFGNNHKLWNLSLSSNQLTGIDFTGAPAIYQMTLDNNQLSSIDLSGLPELRVLYLDNNRFDFTNLPVPQEQWSLYTYGNQPELTIEARNGQVDLSSQAQRDGSPTTYTWFYGRPEFDSSTGTLTGEELILGEEYTVENGVTTFLSDLDRVCCVLTNPLFPRTYLQTNVIAVSRYDGIESTPAAHRPTPIYDLQGRPLPRIPSRGLYIRDGKKVLVK